MYFDIHSHILPKIDDGAKNMEDAVKLLKMCKADGIAYILATPHFYPNEDVLSVFTENVKKSYNSLATEIKGKNLPEIYIGSEVLYFKGLGSADGLENLTLNGTAYILIELSGYDINKGLFEDLTKLKSLGYLPIIAHFERYRRSKGFNRLLRFAKKKKIILQINSASVFNLHIMGLLKKILKRDIMCVLATDTHSVKHRPPLMSKAMAYIKEKLGYKYYSLLLNNSVKLYKRIIGDSFEEQ